MENVIKSGNLGNSYSSAELLFSFLDCISAYNPNKKKVVRHHINYETVSNFLNLMTFSILKKLFVFYIASLFLFSVNASALEISEWKELKPGLEMSEASFWTKENFVTTKVLLLKISTDTFKFEVAQSNPSSSVKKIAKEHDASIAINASFFEPSLKPLGLIVTNSNKQQRIHRGGKLLGGILYFKKNKGKIIHRSEYSDELKARFALQSGPRLIENGKALNLLGSHIKNRRSGIALNEENNVILFTTYSRFPGASLHQIQNMLLAPKLAIKNALNLDGGSSSQLFFNYADKEVFIDGGHPIPVALIAKEK